MTLSTRQSLRLLAPLSLGQQSAIGSHSTQASSRTTSKSYHCSQSYSPAPEVDHAPVLRTTKFSTRLSSSPAPVYILPSLPQPRIAPSTSSASLRLGQQLRFYASQSLNTTPSQQQEPRRRRVTVTNDTGQVPWGQLTSGERIARTTQQTVNFGVIAVGGLATVAVAWLLWDQVFSPDSKTAHFDRAFDVLREDPRVIELLGPAESLRAYGESSWSKWTRNRAISSTLEQDGAGRDHLMMQFFVEGSRARGRAKLHMVRPSVGAAFVYKAFTLDVPGHSTVYLYSDDRKSGDKKRGFNFLGVRWGG